MATRTSSARVAALLIFVCLAVSGLMAQTVIKMPKNKYTPEQDVKLGLEAAADVAARGEMANALGEGFADGLDVGGF